MTDTSTENTIMSVTQECARRSVDAASWLLPRGEARRLSVGPGDRWLKVAEGQVWLTTAGSGDELAEDQWLKAGEQVWLADGSEVVIEARGEACFQLLVPPAACARRGALWDLASTSLARLASALTPHRVTA